MQTFKDFAQEANVKGICISHENTIVAYLSILLMVTAISATVIQSLNLHKYEFANKNGIFHCYNDHNLIKITNGGKN